MACNFLEVFLEVSGGSFVILISIRVTRHVLASDSQGNSSADLFDTVQHSLRLTVLDVLDLFTHQMCVIEWSD